MILQLDLNIQREISDASLNIEGALFDVDLSIELGNTINLVR